MMAAAGTIRTRLFVAAIFVAAFSNAAVADKINLAIFNFQMKTGDAEWKWLEKGLADQMTNDCCRSKMLNVLARDEMQYLAIVYNWTPEFVEKSTETIAQNSCQFKLDYIISGIYTIADGKIEIVGQIINLKTNKEVYRAKVSGELDQTLDLQKQLSAKLLSWFSKVSAEEIYKQLPVWTRSIRAARAVYEGMNYFDQGRYEEAWGKFRDAVALDANYMEAWYWVGRMYYFMGRYEHARLEFDRFIYASPSHPRVGDAIKEYLHSWEKTANNDKYLMSLYDQIYSRYSDVKIYNALCEEELVADLSVDAWLDSKRAQLRACYGDYSGVAKMFDPAADQLHRQMNMVGYDVLSNLAMRCAMTDHMKTGKVFYSAAINKRLSRYPTQDFFIRCREGITRMETDSRPVRFCPHGRDNGRPATWYFPFESIHTLLAPEGKVFKSVKVTPILSSGEKVDVHFTAGMGLCDELFDFNCDANQAGKDGFTLDKLPRTGMLCLRFYFSFEQKKDPKINFCGLEIDAKLEDVGEHGSVEIACLNTDDFTAYIDDVPVSKGNGLAGLLSPGKHMLRVTAGAYRPYQSEIFIEKGRTVRHEFSLSWKDESPLRSFTVPQRVCSGYPSTSISLVGSKGVPAIQADDKAIRMIWSYQGDLWSAVSSDGEKFQPTRKLDMPVSSGWMEDDPKFFRAESGKFVLVFASDREARHLRRTYVCWSRDFEHWSRPTMIVDCGMSDFDIAQDKKGKYIFAAAIGNQIRIWTSYDLHEWKEVGNLNTDSQEVRGIALNCRDDGYDIIVGLNTFETNCCYRSACHCAIARYVSSDGISWTEIGTDCKRSFYAAPIISASPTGDYYLVWFDEVGNFMARSNTGPDKIAERFSFSPISLVHHPKWGYIVAWNPYLGWKTPVFPQGPLFIRGRQFEFSSQSTSQPATIREPESSASEE